MLVTCLSRSYSYLFRVHWIKDSILVLIRYHLFHCYHSTITNYYGIWHFRKLCFSSPNWRHNFNILSASQPWFRIIAYFTFWIIIDSFTITAFTSIIKFYVIDTALFFERNGWFKFDHLVIQLRQKWLILQKLSLLFETRRINLRISHWKIFEIN